MFNHDEKIKLTDLIDIELLQKLQDTFAKTMGVASIAVDDKGPITKPSNFTDFCIKYTRETAEGYKRCNECDIRWGKVAAESGKPVIYDCHSGLRDFAVPIVVGEKHIASILGGQILTQKPDEEHFRKLARELGINEDEYIEALRKIKVVPPETVDAAANFLYLVANTISKVAHKNLELIKKSERENIQRKIIEKIRSSLDIDETLGIIAYELSKMFDVERVSIVEFPNKENYKDYIVRKEYKIKEDIKSPQNIEGAEEITQFAANQFFKAEKLLVIDDIAKSEFPEFFKEFYKIMGTNSLLWFPIMIKGQLWGSVALAKHDGCRYWTDEDVQIVIDISNQIAIAMNQAKLYQKEKETAQREIILRDIISIIRSSLDLEEIKHEIAYQIGKFLNADGVRIAYYDYNLGDYIITEASEYRSSEKLRSWVGVKFKNIPGFVDYIRNVHLQGKDIIFSDLEKYLDENSLRGTGVEKFYRHFGFTSSAAINIYYGNKYVGDFVVTFENKKDFSQNEIDFLKTLADQAGTAFYQAELYESEKQTAKREAILAKVTDTIRSTLDMDKIFDIIAHELAKVFNVERVVIAEYPDSVNLNNWKLRYEYIDENHKTKIKGLKNGLMDTRYGVYWAEQVFGENKTWALDDIPNSSTPDYFRKTYELIGAKSSIGVAFKSEMGRFGILALITLDYYKHWSQDDISLLEAITNQINIAINQAELYKQEKESAERESLIGTIISQVIRTFDIKQIKQLVTEIGILTKADRCYFVEVDLSGMGSKTIESGEEYIASSDIKSMVGYTFPAKDVQLFVEMYLKTRDLIVFDYEEIAKNKEEEYQGINRYSSMSKLKSGVGIPFIYMDKLIAVLCIEYVKEKILPSGDELDFLRILGNQVGLAFSQIQLFQSTKLTAKREALLRLITEKIRSSLDLDETLSFICEETAKLFNAQRSAIAQFPNPENFEEYIIKKEYKSSSEIRGIAQAEDFPKTAAYWGSNLMATGKVLTFNNIEKSDTPDYFKNTYNLMGIKSMMGTSIRKDKNVWGTLVLSEYNNYRHWTDEEKILLKAIADQVYIAINQAELFEKEQKRAENEKTLREIMLSSVSSFEIEKIIKSIVTEAGKLFKADRCFYIEINLETMSNLPIQDYAEYLSSSDIKSHLTRQPTKDETVIFFESMKQKKLVTINNVETADLPELTRKMLVDDLSIKSYLVAPIYYVNQLYGSLVLHYTQDFKKFSQDELDMITAISNQSAVILHQAELYEITKVQAEREKISKNIIEILRSTLDKSIIKKLFVKNIGKFLEADGVLFSEYDSNGRKYLPVDENSEFLSSSDLNSFVGYDWSCEEAQEYIQPLLDKREFHIYNWGEYIQSNSRSQDFINLFERRGVKSSYSFPVIYQTKIMGFFSIAFTKQVHRLTDEDINRIRNICTQAGIAFYHADIYEQAQKSVYAHNEFVNKLSNELKDPLNLIIEFSQMESSHALQCHEEIEHLNNVNNNAKKLLFLLEDIIKNSKTKIDFD